MNSLLHQLQAVYSAIAALRYRHATDHSSSEVISVRGSLQVTRRSKVEPMLPWSRGVLGKLNRDR